MYSNTDIIVIANVVLAYCRHSFNSSCYTTYHQFFLNDGTENEVNSLFVHKLKHKPTCSSSTMGRFLMPINVHCTSVYVCERVRVPRVWFLFPKHELSSWRRLRSPVGPMTVKEQQLEGQLRFVNSRVITNR